MSARAPTAPAAGHPPAGAHPPLRSRSVEWSALSVALLGAGAAAGATWLRHRDAARPNIYSDNIFLWLYALNERPFFALLTLFAAATWLYARAAVRTTVAAGDVARSSVAPQRTPPAAALWAGAALFTLVCWAGSHVILHDLPFSMDEFNAVYQARIFESGHVAAPVPAQWRPFAHAMVPVFASYYPAEHAWRSGYLPVYAAIRALFGLAGAEGLTNPVIGGLSVAAIFAAGRRLWPAHPARAWLAALFLATASQFLLTSMSWYSMPAHLLLNLVWLWLYLRDDGPGLALLPVVGVLALGLHNPFPHALFVAPFLVRMLRRRRWGWLLYAALVYGAGSLLWYTWIRASYGYLAVSGGLLAAFALPGSWQLKTQALQLSLMLSWHAPLVPILFLVALAGWRRLGDTERDLALGFVLTAAFHFLFPLNQGHGWGYRYLYPTLGNYVLLAAAGAGIAAGALCRDRIARLVAASTVVALLVQWPLRALQVERVVRPFALASAYVASRPEPVVVIFPDSSYYGRDLVRNDPLLQRSPKIVSATALGDSGMRRLVGRFGGRVHLLRPAELAPFGVPTF